VLLTFQYAWRKLNTEPSICASHQVSFHLAMQFQSNFLEIDQPETIMVYCSHVCWRFGMKWANFIEDLPRMLPTKCWFIWPSGFRGEDLFYKSANQKKKNCLWRPCLSTDRDEMSNPYRRLSIDASYQVTVHLTNQF